MSGFLEGRWWPSPAPAAASAGPWPWPRPPRGPGWWWPTSAWAWPGRTRRARWPRPWWRRSRRPAARRWPWGRASTTLAGGEKIIGAGVERWGRIDGVVAIAGILRERMLFNMAEDEWDAVIETHLKGHFTVFRAASAVMRKQEGGGSLVAFTSGAFAGSVAQANYAAAKGGIVSLVRSAAAGLNRYGITANAVAPVARTRMSANVPMDLAEMGDPEDVAPLVVYLLSDQAKHVTGQVYTSVGSEDRRLEPAPGGPGRLRRRPLDPRGRSPPGSTRRWARSACPSSTSSRRTARRPRPRRRKASRRGRRHGVDLTTRGVSGSFGWLSPAGGRRGHGGRPVPEHHPTTNSILRPPTTRTGRRPAGSPSPCPSDGCRASSTRSSGPTKGWSPPAPSCGTTPAHHRRHPPCPALLAPADSRPAALRPHAAQRHHLPVRRAAAALRDLLRRPRRTGEPPAWRPGRADLHLHCSPQLPRRVPPRPARPLPGHHRARRRGDPGRRLRVPGPLVGTPIPVRAGNPRDPGLSGGYSYATASDRDAFHAITMDFGTGGLAIHGYLLPGRGSGRRWRPVRRRVLERDPVTGYPRSRRPRSGGRVGLGSLHAEGRCLNGLGLALNPNLFSVNCLTEWTFDGITAFGEDHDNWSATGIKQLPAVPGVAGQPTITMPTEPKSRRKVPP